MSWTMLRPHSRRDRRTASQRSWNVQAVPRLRKPLSLVCGVCGASGRYKVGTVMVDPTVAEPSEPDSMEKDVGFSGYFRCRKCDAGGPWDLPDGTKAHVAAMLLAHVAGMEDVPLVIGAMATFDKKTFRYATEGEAHLKKLIDREPDRAFLWVRLGNLYSNAEQYERAEAAYQRALELDPKDIEAHSMYGQLLVDGDRLLEAVPHFHAVLKHVREARQVNKKLRRELVRGSIESLLAAHAQSKGQIDLLPTAAPAELRNEREDEPVVLHLREFDLSSDEGIDELCECFLEPPRSRWADLFGRSKRKLPEAWGDAPATPVHRAALAVGRNAPCPCGSGHKYKKCCGR